MGQMLWDGYGKTTTGASVVSFELTKHLCRFYECDMIFETSDRRKIGEIKETSSGFRTRYISRPDGIWKFDESFLRNYDLIHIYGNVPIFAYRAFTRSFIPHCLTLHSAISMLNWIGLASAFYIHKHDVITLASRCLFEALTKYWKFSPTIIPYGVNTDFFKPANKKKCRSSLGIPKDKTVIGYLGRLAKFNPVIAYRIFKQVKNNVKRKDLLLLVAGGTKKIKPVRVKDDFIFLGYLEKAKVPDFLNSCDIFLNPVTGLREGFGLNIIEAMSCGLPIVSTYWNGYTDTITSEEGFLTRTCWKNGDVFINLKDLSLACSQLVENKALREEMGKKARKRVIKYYTWDLCVKNYKTIFDELINQKTLKEIPYQNAPAEVNIKTKLKEKTLSLEALLKNPNFGLDFKVLHERFVSNSQIIGSDWERYVCVDNIVNLPKYKKHMKGELEKLKTKFKTFFPKFVKVLET
jgi:glycosyltransferase involved in cell wall biosynthesis